jgi:hypothetical protein
MKAVEQAVELMMDIVKQGGDLSATMRQWMDKSDKAGWPKTDVGWHRWLVRKLEVGDFPKMRGSLSKQSNNISSLPPEGFGEWFMSNPEARDADGKLILPLQQAWNTQRYRHLYMEAQQVAA